MDCSELRQKYQKYKLRVKLWEKGFKKKHGRIPSKYDIREASHEIRDSYKMYYKLKTSFLEDTLNDVLSDDGFDVLDISQRDADMNESVIGSINGGPQIPLDITKLVEQHHADDDNSSQKNKLSKLSEPSSSFAQTNQKSINESQVLKEFKPVGLLSLNDNVWGPNVSMKHALKNKDVPIHSIKSNFKDKLFQNSSFSIRNPRKSLQKSLVNNSITGSPSDKDETLNNRNKEILPDLEMILLQKAKEQQATSIITHPILAVEKCNERSKSQLDKGWLERNIDHNDIKLEENISKAHKVEDNQKLTETCSKSIYGITNLDMSKLQTKSMTVKEHESVQTDKLQNSKLNFDTKNPDVFNLKDISLEPVKKFQKKSYESDSMVDDSEEEKELQKYRHIVKRRRIMSSVTLKMQENANVCQADLANAQLNRENLVSNHDDLKKDFSEKSEQEDNDNNFEQNKTKAKRKKGYVKKTSYKLKSSTKVTQKINAKEKMKTPIKSKKTINKSSKKKVTNCKDVAKELEESPLSPDNLKLTLALERVDLTSIPRIKQTDLDSAESLAKEYIYSMTSIKDIVTSKPKPLTVLDDKRAVDRRKLEEKIEAGKLNENFVTINMRKKIFVRGKKTVNYTKYKKKLWKHKKRIAALSGPNMDMGGCDGGTLKCFNCGQAGHFAQNCKIKGDNLLPLAAELEDEESPFPTLEEAERMASQSAVVVHSRNIAKMPQAPNAAIYNQAEQDCSDNNVECEVKINAVNSNIDTGSGDENLSNKEEILMETDDELEKLEMNSVVLKCDKNILPIKKYVGCKIPNDFLQAAGIDPTNPNSKNSNKFCGVEPLYEPNADGSIKGVTTEVLDALKLFGHSNFRKGQDRAVMRILSGMSTLVTLSTGSGKSLCYQLPAYLYSKHKKSITLVISPLVSLMEDQVTGVPHFLRAHCLHTNQTPQQKLKIMKLIAEGEIDVLLVSPEAVVAGERSTGFGSILKQLPPIAFACIDEAHCVSQWSHNFRPSYLMICKVLKQNLGIKCVLGLTATATLHTRISIVNHLGIIDGDKGIISDTPLPDNLVLSVSKDKNRDVALLQLLLSKRFEGCHSIIIYCTRRDECERVAGYLRTCLQDNKASEQENGKKKRKRVNWHAEPYHAGMPAARRRTIQNAFMMNELRIVVATIAFGMGINKPDIRAVIHYNMPRNFESYVQEVGRAGRDNKISHCHVFLDGNGDDQNELKRHIYANSLDRHVIRKLLQHIFIPCSCDKNPKIDAISNEALKKIFSDEEHAAPRPHICQGHEIGFSVEKTVEALDIPEENISTLLCYMELDNRWCINVLSNAYITAKIISYGGPKYMKQAAKECPPLAMAIAMKIKDGSFKEDSNIIEFAVIDVAAAIGWNSGVAKYQLKNLEWFQVNGHPKRSPISVTFYDLGFRIKAPGDFTAEEIDDALDTLYTRSVKQEHTQLIQLQYIFQGLSSVAYNSYIPCCNETFSPNRSDQLKGIVRDYFNMDYQKNLKLEVNPSIVSDAELESDVVTLVNMYPENNFSGRNIARIFHGISSPNYPALIWHRCKFWRVHSKTDFNRIVQLANNVIVKRRT